MFIDEKVCCEYSFEASQSFHGEIRKIFFWKVFPLIYSFERPTVYTCISSDFKPVMMTGSAMVLSEEWKLTKPLSSHRVSTSEDTCPTEM